jgi:nitrogen fixation protein NifQ
MEARATAVSTPRDMYAALMSARRGEPVEDLLARMIASWSLGQGAMPQWLGLSRVRFHALFDRHFPRFEVRSLQDCGEPLDPRRWDEMSDLRNLLMQNISDGAGEHEMMADIVIAGCMGAGHLWQDLGLWERADLSRLMLTHFRPLAMRNERDMKWKKFLYKQLCETEGIYTCRAPSCEVCVDYAVCFGPEDGSEDRSGDPG